MEAACGTVAGRLPAPMTVTPFAVTMVVSGREPATLPPSSPDGQIDHDRAGTQLAPARQPAPAAAAASPGTWAVVMTMSKRAIAASSAFC